MSFQDSKIFKPVAIAVGVVVLAVIIYFIWPKKKPQDGLIEYLQKQNDSLRIENYQAKIRDSIREVKVDSLFNEMKGIDKEIIRTKEYHEKIIHHYDTAGVLEIQRFFTDRYK